MVDGSGRKLGYGEIASFAKVPSPLPAVEKSELKDKSQFRYIGKPMPRRDTPLKVNGTAKYAIDVDLPGMVYATARHTPVHGGSAGELERRQGEVDARRDRHGAAARRRGGARRQPAARDGGAPGAGGEVEQGHRRRF